MHANDLIFFILPKVMQNFDYEKSNTNCEKGIIKEYNAIY